MKRILALALMACAGTAQAQVWVEVGDAPEAPAFQMTVGVGALTAITGGGIAGAADFSDAYCISISDVASFSATTVGGTSQDTQLWLFTMGGMGVTFNDDSSGLQSTITGAFVSGPGDYILAVSTYDYDANSAGGAIWLDTPFGTQRAPDGPGAASPVSGWSGGAAALTTYRIALTGASYCEVPAPGALALLGLGGLVAARRRR
jgi:MYXO-CTERM domain-containing protein